MGNILQTWGTYWEHIKKSLSTWWEHKGTTQNAFGNTKFWKNPIWSCPFSPRWEKNWASWMHIASPHWLRIYFIFICVGHHFWPSLIWQEPELWGHKVQNNTFNLGTYWEPIGNNRNPNTSTLLQKKKKHGHLSAYCLTSLAAILFFSLPMFFASFGIG